MSSAVLQSYFTRHQKKFHEDCKKIFKMFGEVSSTGSSLKLEVEGEEKVLTKRKLTSMFNGLFNSNAPTNRLFKLANRGINLRYAPVFLSKDAIDFFKNAKSVIGSDTLSNLHLFKKYGLIEQRSLDVLWNIYVNKQELYKKATQNITRVEEGKNESKQYVSVDDRIRKYLRKPLEGLVESFKGKKYTPDDINFDGEETVDNLLDFKLFHFSRVKKHMALAKPKLNKQQHSLIDRPSNNKIFKEYEKLIFAAKIDADLSGEEFSETTFFDAAVKVSQMELKDKSGKEYKIGPYTQKQIKSLDVDKTNGSLQLAIRSLLDTEILILKKIKAQM